MAASGVATTTMSPASAASATLSARPPGPSSATRSFSVSGPRELLSTTMCPAATLSRATVLPILPLPMNPMVAIPPMISPPGPGLPGRGLGGELVVADVLVDHAGAHVGDLGALGQPVDDEGVQILVVRHGHVDEEVLVAGHHEHADGLRQRAHPVPEPFDGATGRRPDPDRDQRLDPPADGGPGDRG